MVASMPACVSFVRYFLSQTKLVSFIESYLASARSKRYVKSRLSADCDNLPGDTDRESNRLSNTGGAPEKASDGRYWKLKNLFRRNVPPQLTSVTRESGLILNTGDFVVFNAKSSSENFKTSFEREEKDR